MSTHINKVQKFLIRSQSGWRSLLALVPLSLCAVALSAQAASVQPVSSKDVTVSESAGAANFTVSLTVPRPLSYDLYINYFTTDATATSPADYTGTQQGTVIIPTGKLSTIISVPIIDDTIHEPTETFTLTIQQPNESGNTDYLATILDNDPLPTPPPVAPPPPPPPPPPPITPPAIAPPPPPLAPPPPPLLPPPPPPPLLTLPPPAPPQFNPLSAFVQAIPTPAEVPLTLGLLSRSLLLAILMVLLVMFPAEMFNSTLQSNYDEIAGWFHFGVLKRLHKRLRRLPTPAGVVGFSAAGALIGSFLSPDIGFNKASLALVLGMFITLLIGVFVFDVARSWYLKLRHGHTSKLRTHLLGLVAGAVLVFISRLAHFVPGYFYGLFTALIFSSAPPDEHDAEGLAVASSWLLAVALAGWFALTWVKPAAAQAGSGLPVQVASAVLSSLWAGALTAIVFGLAPIRYFYGEQIKKWSFAAWALIYSIGMFLFVHTLLDPNQSYYGKSGKVSLTAVLTLFFGFGLFSLLFWSYFRYRHLWRRN